MSTCKYNLTFVREFTGMSGQQINAGDVVLVHQLINWMMVVVEGLMTGSD